MHLTHGDTMHKFKIISLAVAPLMICGLLSCAGTALARYDSSAAQRQGAYRPTRSAGDNVSGGETVNSPAMTIYDPANIRGFDLYLFEKVIPSGSGYSAMIGGGLYNVGDMVFEGKIKDIKPDSIVVEYPKVTIAQGKTEVTFKPGDKIERPTRKPIITGGLSFGDREREYYETALIEVQDNNFEPAVIAKAIGDSMGNQDLVTSLYINYRVAQLEQDYKDAVTKNTEAARSAAIRAVRESKNYTFVTTIDKKAAKIALKILMPLFIAIIIAWGIFIFTEWSKKW